MGIEGEQLVLDYLSRVGDLAHTTSMSASERAALVVRLRDEIGRQRAANGGEERKSDVKRIIRSMGRPEDVVARAAGGGVPQHAAPAAAGSGSGEGASGRKAGRKRSAAAERLPQSAAAEAELVAAERAAGPEQPVARAQLPEWQDGRIGAFVGGIEIPEMLRPPPAEPDARPGGPEAQALPPGAAVPPPPSLPGAGAVPGAPVAPGAAVPGAGVEDVKTAGERKAGKGWRARARRAVSGGRVGGPIELLAVLSLVAGTVLGSLLGLAAGWVLAYWSPRLSRREAQWTVFGMPGTVVGGYVVWVTGRLNESWGEPLPADVTLQSALADNYPVLLRLSALASALFLLWRARRPKPQG
ncbi:hypothetical protein GCM10009716_03810 [Streptomyces sodiiphilus]|uniref:Integral membrane protein n=1 Tax=Streptomyces sodiiphilus TaxID=226217 RepID=A0ABN2NS85_9ACTN